MKRVLCIFLACFGMAQAVPITGFVDTKTYIKRADDIVIAECISTPKQSPENGRTFECNLLHILKGSRKPGKCKVFTIWPMESGRQYLLANTGGGQAGGTDLFALGELTVISMPSNFSFERIEDKPLSDQLHAIFDLRRHELERQLRPLLEERDLLQKALENRTDNLYVSPGPIEFKEIHNTHAKGYKDGKVTYLHFGSHPMEWSRGSAKTGYIYAAEPVTRQAVWQWAILDKTDFEQLRGKPLRQRFQGVYPPIYGQTLTVREGQMLLLRYGKQPETVYIAKFEKQQADTIHVKYITVTADDYGEELILKEGRNESTAETPTTPAVPQEKTTEVDTTEIIRILENEQIKYILTTHSQEINIQLTDGRKYKGKYVHAESEKYTDDPHLFDILNLVMHIKKARSPEETIDWGIMCE